jgi:acetyltransferase-like isoleucine patch superfamily enzyme
MAKFVFDNRAHLLRLALEAVSERMCTRMSYLLAVWWGCSLGPRCRFRGLPVFRRPESARIVVGTGCSFLSATKSNLHGLNRPCMLNCLSPGSLIEIGDDSGFSGTVIAAARQVSIGKRVLCGANTTISDTDSHSLDYRERHPFHFGLASPGWKEHVTGAPVVIEDDVFLGTGVMVLKGVTIGATTVVGAGSVVARSLPPGVVAAGVPARPLLSLAEALKRTAKRGLGETTASGIER